MKPQIDDIVRFLNDVGGGRVTHIDGNTVYVEDNDGFSHPVNVHEVVVVDKARATAKAYEKPLSVKTTQVPVSTPTMEAHERYVPEQPVVETAEGEELNVVLAFEPKEIKHLSTTTFYAVLVNDSNYFLFITYATRSAQQSQWQLHYSGVVEPNLQFTLEEFGFADLNDREHIALQLVAFKPQKPFALKNPALLQRRIDTTKFYKLHSFHTSLYFDTPVIEIPVVQHDLPVRPLNIDGDALQEAMLSKQVPRNDRRKYAKTPTKGSEPIVVDLHITELLDDHHGMSNAEILEFQLAKFRETMKQYERKAGTKIIFIHGKGEGVLRQALLRELKMKWSACSAQDASFREYGFGATQVTIHHAVSR